jgi:thioredoxin reductase
MRKAGVQGKRMDDCIIIGAGPAGLTAAIYTRPLSLIDPPVRQRRQPRGVHVRSELAVAAGAKATQDGCLEVGDHLETTVSDLFAAGDVVIGLDQISHAMGQAGVAATTIRNYLAKERPLRR